MTAPMLSGGGPLFTAPRPIEDYQIGLDDAFGVAASSVFDNSMAADLVREGRTALQEAVDFFNPAARRFGTASTRYTAQDARQRAKDAGVEIDVPDEGIGTHDFDTLLALRQRQKRAAALLQMRPKGMAGWTAETMGSLAGFAADPINIAASFIPVVGPARYAAALERAGGFLGRTAVRARYGAIEGAVGQAAIEPAELALNAKYEPQYGPADSFLNIVFGGVTGGLLHVGGGGIYDVFVPPYRASQQAARSALKDAIDAAERGGAVEVTPIVEASALKAAAADFERLRVQLGKVAEEERVALERGVRAEERTANVGAASHIETLRGKLAALGEEIASVRARASDAVDLETPSRVAAIKRELEGDISPARRRDLEAELALVTEGRRLTPEQEAREQASLEAEAQGLEAERGRVERKLAKAERQASEMDAGRTTAERALEREGKRVASRRDDVIALATRAMRRAAASRGHMIDADMARSIAEEVLSGRSSLREMVDAFFPAVDGYSVRPDTFDPVTGYEPADVAAVRAKADEAAQARDTEDGIDEQIEGLTEQLEMARAREKISEADEAILELADAFGARTAKTADSYRAAATCLAGAA